MGSPVRLIAAILIACVAASLGLGATYSVTRERIEEQERLREEKSLRAVLPEADAFERVEDEEVVTEAGELTDEVFVALYRAVDDGGAPVGWGVRVAPRGYGGPIQMAVGLDRDGKVSGVSIVSMNETPGLGTKIGDEEFLAQFPGGDAESIDEEAKGLDAVTGATKSSNGVRKGITAAGHVYQEVVVDLDGGASQ
jgi:electron transport complex protein RnfG